MQRAGAWTAVWAPISLATTGAVLEADGHLVKLVDCIVENVSDGDLKKIAFDFRPDLALINTATPSIEHDLATAGVIKSGAPGAKVLAFGIHVTALTEDSLRMGMHVDAVIRGEPEVAARDLARNGINFRGLPGFSWRDGEIIVHEPDRPPVADLEELPRPAWHLVDRNRYIMPFTDRQFLLVATGRGCPYPCSFCADTTFYGHKLRLRNPESVAFEMEEVGRRFGVRDFLFWSESFTLNRDYALSVTEHIRRRGLKVSWVANSRADHVDPELLRAMKDAGCWLIGFGIEAGTEDTLRRMRKGVNLEQTMRAIEQTAEANIGAVAHCVLGYPGETEEDILATIQFIKKLPLDFAQFYCAVPFPGSALYEEAKRNGWINTDDWTRFEQNYSVLDTPWLKATRVMQLRNLAFREFYLRPMAVGRAFSRVSGIKVAFNLAKMLRDFWGWI